MTNHNARIFLASSKRSVHLHTAEAFYTFFLKEGVGILFPFVIFHFYEKTFYNKMYDE